MTRQAADSSGTRAAGRAVYRTVMIKSLLLPNLLLGPLFRCVDMPLAHASACALELRPSDCSSIQSDLNAPS